jgi:hypothetical protein
LAAREPDWLKQDRAKVLKIYSEVLDEFTHRTLDAGFPPQLNTAAAVNTIERWVKEGL